MEDITGWQVISLCGLALWIVVSSNLNVTQRIRSLMQLWVSQRVKSDTPVILRIQKYQRKHADMFFSALSCVVSVPFYTAFLPLLFWTGHCKLARQMTLLMAFCDYMGNCIKDVISAPRPSSPPVRRVTSTKDVISAPRPSSPPVRRVTSTEDEKENALEYGFPSSHTLNTLCLSGYLLHYILDYNESNNDLLAIVGSIMVCLLVFLTGFGRVYLGMHSLIDIVGGLVLGIVILATWLYVSESIDDFVVSGQNASCCSLHTQLPSSPTPSFEYHTAFNGVALGIVVGFHLTYNHFHHENVPRIFTSQLTLPAFVGRMFLGIPIILLVKFCSKALAKWSLPILAYTLGIPVRSTSYVPSLNGLTTDKKVDEIKQCDRHLHKMHFCSKQTYFDVNTGIRLLQYAGLAWSVVDLVPSLFSHIGL